ncbi:tRNA (N6-isopentenyl adenosine(37)-C2)-methylthiotransferase MiaB [bacterium]|jgi:tRNA-2-methylthio-N6-dimethylallyladenosine synthase|nr:tRNA (N6-isopentenyl adenosine(37)-C2)-methylthiotransferase MiaB [bacterium]MBT6832096.1 tRNA (N6-isopentenyl adenosine(37)-C2)-methylthiotransferase MiaB [bacterium]MBT6995877.1 tRNA (N6-isopentenyl adenosine(37)-C2)-methylthiotransferase MiaB [bacterium]
MKSYRIQTFGCQMNYSDSERVTSVLDRCGLCLAGENDSPDVLIFNTCSVRQRAEDKAVGAMRDARKQFPAARIGVTGCMVRQTGTAADSRDQLLKLDSVDFTFRIEDAARLPKILSSFSGFENVLPEFENFFGTGEIENYFRIAPKVKNPAQVFVPITQGCDKFCTYCIVPYTRGREISRPIGEILDECENLVRAGAREITLLGQNVNSFVSDGEKSFPELLKKVDELHKIGLSRTRFTSAHPQDFTDEVVDVLAKMKTACPYVHLPVQHGSDRMLRAMNRNYSVEKYEKIISNLRKKIPNCTLATDVIVGFPGETEDDFWQLCEVARRMRFDFSYTAIFSPRKNTPASRMKKDFIPQEQKRERFHAFDTIVKDSAFARREKFIGQTLEILVESSQPQLGGTFLNGGRSREFLETYFLSDQSLIGKEVSVKITGRKGYVLDGDWVGKNKGKQKPAGLRAV